MTGSEFITLAAKLLAMNPQPSEPLLRTIISRAYYGALHQTLEFLEAIGIPTHSDHGLPPRYLQNCGNTTAVSAGRQLSELQSHRVLADYQLHSHKAVNVAFARENVEMAQSVQTLLDTCLSEPFRSEIVAGVESYRRKVGQK